MAPRPSDLIAKRAKAFRRALTEPEVMLWSRLKGRGRGQPVFRRQFAYEGMIFDFYCPAAKLAVEIDGSTHWSEEKQAKDEARDRWLNAQGIAVMRIGAGSIYRDLNGAAGAVIRQAESLISADSLRVRPSLSTTRSSAGGPPLPLRGKGS
jgi:very-short-patch-repair endonuclease